MEATKLAGLEPASVFCYFEELCGIPHGSGNTKMISDHLVKFAKVVPEEPTMQQDICCVKTVVQATAPRPAQTQTDKQEAQQ